MYYEERWIGGKFCWRTSPDGAWTAYTANELAHRYQAELQRAHDPQRALDAEREKVKELVANQAEYEKCTDEQITALNQGCLDYEKQIAILQAQLVEAHEAVQGYDQWLSGGVYFTMAEYDHHLAAHKAQFRQVERERDQWIAANTKEPINEPVTYQALAGARFVAKRAFDELVKARSELSTLRQLVEALPAVDGRMDVECGACYYIRSFVAEQYGVVCGLITEQATAMAIKALLEYRATLAAKDAPHPTEERS